MKKNSTSRQDCLVIGGLILRQGVQEPSKMSNAKIHKNHVRRNR